MYSLPAVLLKIKQVFAQQNIDLKKALGLMLIHLVVLFSIYNLLVLLGYIPAMDIYFFKQWDANWYASIAQNGYLIDYTQQSNSGFFPLFPYAWKTLWKLTDASVNGVCVMNLLIFFTAMFVLKNAFQFSWASFLLLVSLPSNFFMYVPYTEALFFFFSALILSGLKTKNTIVLITGLFFASLTKPTATFFIPAIVVMELINYNNTRTFLKRVIGLSFIPLLSLVIVILIQYVQTDVWFAYFKAQSGFWHRAFQLPEFPLTTWGGPRIIWVDALAVFFGALATALLAAIFFNRFLLKSKNATELEKVFSLTYLSLALFSVIFFNGRDDLGGTSLMGANRYILANPFMHILLMMLINDLKEQRKYWIMYFILAILTVFAINTDSGDFKNYTQYTKYTYMAFLFILIGLYALIPARFNERFMYALYLINCVCQIMLLQQFESGQWVG